MQNVENVQNVENMFIFPPLTEGYTVYSKSGCGYCTKIKKLLLEKNIFFLEVECDNFLLEDKEQFLLFISEKAKKEYKTFPMVFYNGEFVGGYNEVKNNIEKTEIKFDDI
jgi:glutaredoxin